MSTQTEAVASNVYRMIIAGGRDFTDMERVEREIFDLAETGRFEDMQVELVSGMASGADACCVAVARKHDAVLHEFPADWNQYGKRAGYLRNEQMAEFADGVVAYWDGKSRGTKHMIDIAKRKGLDVWVMEY